MDRATYLGVGCSDWATLGARRGTKAAGRNETGAARNEAPTSVTAGRRDAATRRGVSIEASAQTHLRVLASALTRNERSSGYRQVRALLVLRTIAAVPKRGYAGSEAARSWTYSTGHPYFRSRKTVCASALARRFNRSATLTMSASDAQSSSSRSRR